jgi:hypothetical protein
MDDLYQPERRHGDGCVVGGDDPGDALDRGVEVAVEVRQRQDDDR